MRGGCVRRFIDGAYLLLLLILYNMRYTMPVLCSTRRLVL